MPGIFIISFDCEGKWGIDGLNSHHEYYFTNDRLNKAYEKITNILDRKEIKGTFAFVGAFTMSKDEYQANRDWFSDIFINGENRLAHFKRDAGFNHFDGWLNPDAFDVVKKKPHEIASHSFRHIPLPESVITRDIFKNEMELIKKASKLKGIEPKTFIYPQNLIGYQNQLLKAGFIGYRMGVKQSYIKRSQRLKNLLSEFNIWTRAQEPCQSQNLEQPVSIPSGHFLNWRYSLRKKVPITVTLKKWSYLINDAIQNNRILHLYTHPHNFVDGDQMYLLLDGILKLTSDAIRKGDMVNYTQKEYVNQQLKLQTISL